jgi:hypothetical protein
LCRGCALIFLNGNILGVHRRPKHFVRAFREMRRRGRVGEFVSVYLQHDSVQIASDGGRVCRPLIICDHGVPRVKEEHLKVRFCCSSDSRPSSVSFNTRGPACLSAVGLVAAQLRCSFPPPRPHRRSALLYLPLQLLREGKWNFNSFLVHGLLEYLGGHSLFPNTACMAARMAPLRILEPQPERPGMSHPCSSSCLTHSLACCLKTNVWCASLRPCSCPQLADVNEENNSLVALYEAHCGPRTTHLEIEAFTILGVVAGLIPYPHHNQSPRNTYQASLLLLWYLKLSP